MHIYVVRLSDGLHPFQAERVGWWGGVIELWGGGSNRVITTNRWQIKTF